jgi:hypothetical protein
VAGAAAIVFQAVVVVSGSLAERKFVCALFSLETITSDEM